MAKHPAALKDFELAIKFLQKTWDELCDLKAEMAKQKQDSTHLPRDRKED